MQMRSPVHPGPFLAEEVIGPTGVSVAAAARALGVGRPALSSLLNGRSSLTPEMAARFEKAFGIKMDLILKMQLQYDLARTRARMAEINARPVKPAA